MSCSMTVLMYGALRCSFSLSPKDLPDSHMYSSEQLMCEHLNLFNTLLFLVFNVFILGGHEKGSDGVVTFKVHLDAQTIAGLLELFPKSFCIGYHDRNVFVIGSIAVGVIVLVIRGCWCIVNVSRLLRAHG